VSEELRNWSIVVASMLAISVAILFAAVLANAQVIAVESPAYRSDVRGDTEIRIQASGFKSPLVAKSWLPGDTYGSDGIVATIFLDKNQDGSFIFPANRYPHGPVVIRIYGTRIIDRHVDTCYLQLYNTGGISWNEGIPHSAPPAARGMALVFQDDFNAPLSISSTGAGSRYAAHKPGGGDFSQIPFSDPTNHGPFFQRDTYLIIRADTNSKTTGLLSSISTTDGTGVTVKAPYYLECRFIAPSAPGTWPAWWVVTDEYMNGGWNGTTADEIDVIEAYGGEGLRNPNAPLIYEATPHTWGYHANGTPSGNNHVYMHKYGGGAGWAYIPHTYGLLVTRQDFVFYLDNVEVRRTPATPVAENHPMYFMVDLAIGGNGWPVDLARYGNVVDMYVDFIRAYH